MNLSQPLGFVNLLEWDVLLQASRANHGSTCSSACVKVGMRRHLQHSRPSCTDVSMRLQHLRAPCSLIHSGNECSFTASHRRGGLVIGGLAGVFYGVQMLSSVARAKRDYKDTMAAGLATGMVFGVACARPESCRKFQWSKALRTCMLHVLLPLSTYQHHTCLIIADQGASFATVTPQSCGGTFVARSL